ncbi:MAG: hypothetical protein KA444_02060 [Bacteroidia bacterium]|nr:hypothetical protein [Bacteroidia bacterium]
MIRKSKTKELKGFKNWLNPPEYNCLHDIFIYETDGVFLKKLVKRIKHIAFQKAIIKFLAEHNDKDVPKLIFEFTSRGYTKGYRSSLLLILEKYDCSKHFREILSLFLKDSNNTTWYSYDILIKYLKKIKIKRLNEASILISSHILKEKETDKNEYHELLLKKIQLEIKKRSK